MKPLNISYLKIDNQNIFQFSNDPERYLFPLEISDEVFCNYVSRDVYVTFCNEVLNSFSEKYVDYISERNKINSISCDITRYLEDLKPVGKKITENSFRFKVKGFVANFNYFVDTCCSILASLGDKVSKEDYFLDDENIIDVCKSYGDAEIYKIRKRQQEKIIDGCAKDVSKYFSYLCIAEEIVSMEGENLSVRLAKEIADVRYAWEFLTLSNISNDCQFMDLSLDVIYSSYMDVCRKYEIFPKEEDFFRGKYPSCMSDIFKYRVPVDFYENVYLILSDKEKENINSLSRNAYFSGDGEELLKIFKGHEDNFDKNEIKYDNIKQVFYYFLVNGYYPPTFSFECFFDDENNILIKERFFEDRLGRNFLDYNGVGRFFDIYDYHKAFNNSIESDKEFKNIEDSVFLESPDELFRRIDRLKYLVSEYVGKEYIPICDINRLAQAILNIENDIKDEMKKNDGKISYSFFDKNRRALACMEEENRIAFLNYKNTFLDNKIPYSDSTGEEDFGNDIDANIARICESVSLCDEDVFDASGNEVSKTIDVKKIGIRKIINEKYLFDLKKIRAFVNKNSSNQELILLIRDAEKILDIASKGYHHDECLQSSFDWFEKTEPSIIDGIEYFIHLNKVPSSYKIS